jgi:hypothetical protein
MAIKEVLQILSGFGLPGLVLFMWWWDSRKTMEMLEQYREHMVKQERWYENNVELVKAFNRICDNQQEVCLMVTSIMVRVEGKIDTNQYCPLVRHKTTSEYDIEGSRRGNDER